MLFLREGNHSKGMTERNINTTDLPTDEEGVARLRFAEQFVDEVLLPGIANGSITREEEITQLFSEFQKNNLVLGSDCGLLNVWFHTFEADLLNDCVAKTNPAQLPADASHLKIAVDLLEQILFNDVDDDEDQE